MMFGHAKKTMRSPHRLKIEITVIVILKIALITLIWYFFFSHPLNGRLDDRMMEQHLYAFHGKNVKAELG